MVFRGAFPVPESFEGYSQDRWVLQFVGDSSPLFAEMVAAMVRRHTLCSCLNHVSLAFDASLSGSFSSCLTTLEYRSYISMSGLIISVLARFFSNHLCTCIAKAFGFGLCLGSFLSWLG